MEQSGKDITEQIKDFSDMSRVNVDEINADMDAVNIVGATFEGIFKSIDPVI